MCRYAQGRCFSCNAAIRCASFSTSLCVCSVIAHLRIWEYSDARMFCGSHLAPGILTLPPCRSLARRTLAQNHLPLCTLGNPQSPRMDQTGLQRAAPRYQYRPSRMTGTAIARASRVALHRSSSSFVGWRLPGGYGRAQGTGGNEEKSTSNLAARSRQQECAVISPAWPACVALPSWRA